MSAESVDPETIEGLARKLESLDLSGDEERLLGAIFDRAADAGADVEGYGVVFEVEVTLKDGRPAGGRTVPGDATRWLGPIARGTGLGPDQLGVWTDMRPRS